MCSAIRIAQPDICCPWSRLASALLRRILELRGRFALFGPYWENLL